MISVIGKLSQKRTNLHVNIDGTLINKLDNYNKYDLDSILKIAPQIEKIRKDDIKIYEAFPLTEKDTLEDDQQRCDERKVIVSAYIDLAASIDDKYNDDDVYDKPF